MKIALFSPLVFFFSCLLHLCVAQQYAGDVIPNSLPAVPGSEIVYFKVNDPKGINNHLTVTNYYSLQANHKKLDPTRVQRAIIVIHGLDRDPGTYMSNVYSAFTKSSSGTNFDRC